MPTLNWIGKDAVMDPHKQVPFRLLKPVEKLSVSSPSLLGEGPGERWDGRFLVMEYKGANLWSGDDARQKRTIGKVWEDKSDGQCLFLMPEGPDWNAIHAKIG